MKLVVDISVTSASGRGGRMEGGPPPPPPPPPPPVLPEADANLLAINADGWTAEYFVEGGPASQTWANRLPFDADDDDNLIVVERPGFNAAGEAVTVSDLVRVTTELRIPYDAAVGSNSAYPLQRAADNGDATSRVVLSELVYKDDVIADVANNSTLDYPLPQFLWLRPDNDICTDTLRLEAFVSHWHARQGRPVAAVRFIVSDGTGEVSVLVNTTSFVDYAASGLGCPAFVADVDVSSLDDGPLTVNAVVYPWVGEAFDLAEDGLTGAQDMQSRPMTAWKNPARTYAYVTTAGTSSGTASSDPAVAAGAPFDTYANALAALRTVIGGGDCSGGVIRFGEGTWIVPGGNATETAGAPLVLEPVDPANRATTTLEPLNTSIPNRNLDGRTIVRDLRLNRIAGSSTLFRGRQGNAEFTLSVERCIIHNSGSDSRPFFIRDTSRLWLIDCDQTGPNLGLVSASGANDKNANVIGCRELGGNAVVNAVACHLTQSFCNAGDTSGARPSTSEGMVFAFNRTVKLSGSNQAFSAGGQFLVGSRRGIGVVGNLFIYEGGTSTLVEFWTGGSSPRQAVNVVLQANTSPVGGDTGRTNFMYANSQEVLHGQMRQCVWPRWATKSDLFDDDPDDIGGWRTAFRVGWQDNLMWEGASPPNRHLGPGSWSREVEHRNLQFPASAFDPADLWEAADDFYTPKADSGITTVEEGWTCYAFDMLGRPVPDDGTAFVGAIQRED